MPNITGNSLAPKLKFGQKTAQSILITTTSPATLRYNKNSEKWPTSGASFLHSKPLWLHKSLWINGSGGHGKTWVTTVNRQSCPVTVWTPKWMWMQGFLSSVEKTDIPIADATWHLISEINSIDRYFYSNITKLMQPASQIKPASLSSSVKQQQFNGSSSSFWMSASV